jgi:hypothetical protein
MLANVLMDMQEQLKFIPEMGTTLKCSDHGWGLSKKALHF